ncbi:hypothetical protein E2C01_100986 [Portunus trituberculatus]|uniref:Uncharacterized protein n=1 Tax=Portunus trituberculatus TaxID=210409 RepID=A0A5B7KEQ7_PORTR|nr:hypothetical protein [Portunus trituberculatus]
MNLDAANSTQPGPPRSSPPLTTPVTPFATRPQTSKMSSQPGVSSTRLKGRWGGEGLPSGTQGLARFGHQWLAHTIVFR